MNNHYISLFAGILGLLGVALGAFGAHALKARLADAGTLETWRTAVQYHLLHAVALFALGLFLRRVEDLHSTRLRWAGVFWIAGTLLFSGSLYALALGGPRLLGPITPLGGLCLLVGWILVIADSIKTRPS